MKERRREGEKNEWWQKWVRGNERIRLWGRWWKGREGKDDI